MENCTHVRMEAYNYKHGKATNYMEIKHWMEKCMVLRVKTNVDMQKKHYTIVNMEKQININIGNVCTERMYDISFRKIKYTYWNIYIFKTVYIMQTVQI